MQGTKAELFPSEFFVGDELPETWSERLTITGWNKVPMFDEREQKEIPKPALLFADRKPMPLNVTNFESLERLTGKHSVTEFVGYSVVFYRTLDKRNKKPCIRIDEKQNAIAPQAAKHWMLIDEKRNAFMDETQRLGMEPGEVLDALKVKKSTDYKGTFEQAIQALQDWRTAHSDPAPVVNPHAPIFSEPQPA